MDLYAIPNNASQLAGQINKHHSSKDKLLDEMC